MPGRVTRITHTNTQDRYRKFPIFDGIAMQSKNTGKGKEKTSINTTGPHYPPRYSRCDRFLLIPVRSSCSACCSSKLPLSLSAPLGGPQMRIRNGLSCVLLSSIVASSRLPWWAVRLVTMSSRVKLPFEAISRYLRCRCSMHSVIARQMLPLCIRSASRASTVEMVPMVFSRFSCPYLVANV